MGMVQLLFPFLSKLYFQKVVIAIPMLGLFLDGSLRDNIGRALRTKQGNVLIFLVFWMLMSVPFAVYPGASFAFLTQTFWKVLVLALLVLAYASSMESLNKIIWSYILAIGMLSVLTVTAPGASRVSIEGSRIDPNDTALQLILALPFIVWKYRSSKGIIKIILGFLSLFLLIGIIETKSRGGFLGLLAVTLVTIFQIKRIEKGSLLKMLVPVLAVGIIIFYVGGNEYTDRISTIGDTSGDYNVISQTGRMNIWKRGIDMMINNPLLGVGIICFVSAEGRLYADTGAKWNAAHNSFVQIGAELGFPGLIAFCFLIWSSINNVRAISSANKGLSTDDFKIITSYSIIGSWTGFIVSGFFLSAAYISAFYFLLALSIAFVTIERKESALMLLNNKKGL